MIKRLFAIAFIYAVTCVAWAILGGTIFERTNASSATLADRVGSTWGTSQEQPAPSATVEKVERRVVDGPDPAVPPDRNGNATTRTHTEVVRTHIPIALEQTRATVGFDLQYRQKGLLWYSTYGVAFSGTYRFRNTADVDDATLAFRLPAAQAMYDDLRVLLDGEPVPYNTVDQRLLVDTRLKPGETATLQVSYHSQGLDKWQYTFGENVTSVKDFQLDMRTNFAAVDFPENTLSPTTKAPTSDGWNLTWRYASLVSGFQIGMAMPQKLQPGPLAGQIAFFAPVSLLFFFAVMFLIVTIREIDLHPMNYAFLAAGFFAFHLLLAYLVDHISIHASFVIASIVSIGLVTSYLRLAVGPKFAFVEAAAAQLVYLVLFSYAFFFKGFTGLAITIGSIVTLFTAMQMTGRIKWSEVFARQSRADRMVSPRAATL
jgi:hypothetical protein